MHTQPPIPSSSGQGQKRNTMDPPCDPGSKVLPSGDKKSSVVYVPPPPPPAQATGVKKK
ncbi:hypothetical protein FRB97_004010 [Tulasnella sp. 331]|nr:hypothetical protein FRB97_004010 [Tulasnella sp. 331]